MELSARRARPVSGPSEASVHTQTELVIPRHMTRVKQPVYTGRVLECCMYGVDIQGLQLTLSQI